MNTIKCIMKDLMSAELMWLYAEGAIKKIVSKEIGERYYKVQFITTNSYKERYSYKSNKLLLQQVYGQSRTIEELN